MSNKVINVSVFTLGCHYIGSITLPSRRKSHVFRGLSGFRLQISRHLTDWTAHTHRSFTISEYLDGSTLDGHACIAYNHWDKNITMHIMVTINEAITFADDISSLPRARDRSRIPGIYRSSNAERMTDPSSAVHNFSHALQGIYRFRIMWQCVTGDHTGTPFRF